VDDARTQDGWLCFGLQSQKPLEATPERLSADHRLVCHLALQSDASATYALESETAEIKIRVQYLRLRLWVVPGLRRHTSEAVAHLELQPSHRPLGEQALYLTTEAPPGMGLNLDGCASQ
jgi:hypothetical protein